MSEYTIPWDNLAEVSENKKTGIIRDLELPETATLKEKNLIFYPGYTLVQARIESSDSKPEEKYFIWKPGDVDCIQLDGSSIPIHDANERACLKLNQDTVKDYIRFFCDFVCGEAGPFTIIEGLGSPRFERKYQTYIDQAKFNIEGQDELVEGKGVPNDKKEEIIARISPMEIREIDGEFKVDVCVWYDTILFKAEFTVATDGWAEMADDAVLLKFPSTGVTPWHDAPEL